MRVPSFRQIAPPKAFSNHLRQECHPRQMPRQLIVQLRPQPLLLPRADFRHHSLHFLATMDLSLQRRRPLFNQTLQIRRQLSNQRQKRRHNRENSQTHQPIPIRNQWIRIRPPIQDIKKGPGRRRSQRHKKSSSASPKPCAKPHGKQIKNRKRQLRPRQPIHTPNYRQTKNPH